MPKIFISHALENNEISRKLATHLRHDGAETWLYYAQIEVGDRLPYFLKEAIEWCDTFLLIWSKESANVYNVKLECRRALVLKKKIILCLLDNSEQTIGLRRSLYIDFKNFEKGYNSLIDLLNLKANKEELPQDTPDEQKDKNQPILQIIRYRGQPIKLSEDEVKIMIKRYNFFDLKRNENGRCIDKNFELQNVNGNKIIFDPTSGLMWQNSGSSYSMWYNEAEAWIKELNNSGYAGYSDWRFPTLEEAMSLMKNERKSDGLFIDPLFDNQQLWIWTSDLSDNASRAWVVFFNYGSCYMNCFDFNNYVRAVRSEN